MNKVIGLFIALTLVLGFGAASNVHALPMGDGTYVGGTQELLNAGYVTGNPDFADQDRPENIDRVIGLYNGANDPDLPTIDPLSDFVEFEISSGDVLEDTAGIISLGLEADYISLKWDSVFGLWYIRGLTEFEFSGLSHDLSHYRLHNPVPEPATMLLLGTGLIGLAGYGRRKFKK